MAHSLQLLWFFAPYSVPTAFITGISGAFYRQFAITIASSTIISAIVSLTLSPALAALFLRPHDHEEKPGFWMTFGRPFNAFFTVFNKGFEKLSNGYAGLTPTDRASRGVDAPNLCGSDWPDLLPNVPEHAVWVYPTAGPWLFHRGHHFAAGI